jgi:hypothetical protein
MAGAKVERQARALCAELARVTGSRPQQWCAAQAIGRAIGLDDPGAAVAYAIGRDWMLGGGAPPHSISLTEAGRVVSAASKRKRKR